MCDVEKYNQIFRDIKKLHHQDIVQLMLEAESEEAREFFAMVESYFLYKEQRKIFESNYDVAETKEDIYPFIHASESWIERNNMVCVYASPRFDDENPSFERPKIGEMSEEDLLDLLEQLET